MSKIMIKQSYEVLRFHHSTGLAFYDTFTPTLELLH